MNLGSFFRLSAHLSLQPVLESGEETTLIGGQAVMEGVMMRAPHSVAIAVRRPDGTIAVHTEPIERPSEQNRIWKWPVFRGLATLGQALWLGTRALQYSAQVALDAETTHGKPAEKGGDWKLWLNIGVTIAMTVVMYKLIPLKLTEWLATQYPVLQGQVANAAVDGVIRLIIFGGVLFGLSRMKDIRRVFEYHGAEHRVVFNFESGKPLSVANAQQFVTWHPRCGTSFMLVVMIVSMILYMFVPFQGFWFKFVARLVLLMPIVGISYEVVRFAARRRGSLLALITAPGLWLQRITTQPPADDQTEIALEALNQAMALEKAQNGELVIA